MSQSHLAESIEKLLKKCFPSYRYKKEYYVLYQNTQLFFDFYLSELKLLIEVQGQQHYSFNKLFHASKENFLAQKYRDRLKTQYIDEVGKKLLVIPFDEIPKLTEAEFRSRIIKAL